MNDLPFHKKLFNLARLGILETLSGEGAISFSDLKAVCGLTDGNLVAHLRVLEKLNFVVSSKCFVDKKPRTTYTVTLKGEENLKALKVWFYDTFLEGEP